MPSTRTSSEVNTKACSSGYKPIEQTNQLPSNPVNSKIALAIALFVGATPVLANDPFVTNVRWIALPVEKQQIVNQGKSNKACGYASILNSLFFGNSANRKVFQSLPGNTNADRIKYLEDTYGSKPSKDHGNGLRNREHGVTPNDICDIYNEIRKEHGLPPLTSSYLNRRTNETEQQLLTRVHGLLLDSLKSQEPPILSVRSAVADWCPTIWYLLDAITGQNPMRNQCGWQRLTGHFITVVGVPEKTNEDGSFCVDYLDPRDGRERQLFVYSDVRNFAAWKGASEVKEFVRDRPFPAIASGSIYLSTQDQVWSARTEVYLDHVIYKE
jgi:hypothetical protein